WSQDGKTIATASDDNNARLWNADTGKVIATLNHQDWVNAVAWIPDGKIIATASDDNTARLWNADTGKAIATLNHQDWVSAVTWSQDGKTIATASDDNTARLHWVMPEDLMTEACRRLSRNFTVEEWQRYMNSRLDTYQKTCEELPVHRSLIAEAKKLAKTGEKEDIKTVISILKRAQELDAEIDLDPDTEIIEKDPEVVAKKFAAPGKIEEGKKLAQQGKIEKAISMFKEAQELSPEIDINPDTEIIEKYPEVVANKFVATGKVEEGKKLAKQGKIQETITLYEQAQRLDSDVEIDANDWGELCRSGSLNNQAQDVIFACENAVELSPDNGFIQGSRGLARALTGDYPGAIEDFQVLVNSLEYEEEKAKVEGWIETLKKGENPITSEELDKLKN
ncbi:MAG: hypothetical protein F6K39_47650, partial [Okeania sp. SIO3B3]|nr:hypothetical protein [Okeania sp. SIO3B3]